MWRRINAEVQKLSQNPGAQQPVLTKDLVEACLAGIDRCFTDGVQRVKSRANSIFSSVFGGPNPFAFEPFAIRWPGENEEALIYVKRFIAAAYQIPWLRSNSLDHGILEDHAAVIFKSLVQLKAEIMTRLFQIEVQGDFSASELAAIFRNTDLRPPLRESFSDNTDTAAGTAVEDARAMTDETVVRPTRDTAEAAANGVGVWTWVPTAGDWLVFGEYLRRTESDGPAQTPGAPFPFSVGVISS